MKQQPNPHTDQLLQTNKSLNLCTINLQHNSRSWRLCRGEVRQHSASHSPPAHSPAMAMFLLWSSSKCSGAQTLLSIPGAWVHSVLYQPGVFIKVTSPSPDVQKCLISLSKKLSAFPAIFALFILPNMRFTFLSWFWPGPGGYSIPPHIIVWAREKGPSSEKKHMTSSGKTWWHCPSLFIAQGLSWMQPNACCTQPEWSDLWQHLRPAKILAPERLGRQKAKGTPLGGTIRIKWGFWGSQVSVQALNFCLVGADELQTRLWEGGCPLCTNTQPSTNLPFLPTPSSAGMCWCWRISLPSSCHAGHHPQHSFPAQPKYWFESSGPGTKRLGQPEVSGHCSGKREVGFHF